MRVWSTDGGTLNVNGSTVFWESDVLSDTVEKAGFADVEELLRWCVDALNATEERLHRDARHWHLTNHNNVTGEYYAASCRGRGCTEPQWGTAKEAIAARTPEQAAPV